MPPKSLARPIITFSIEHKEREFRPKVLLAGHLASLGFRVYIGSTEAVDTIARKDLPPSIIFHKSRLGRHSAFYKSKGHKFIFLDEEGGPAIPKSKIETYCQKRYRHLSESSEDVILLSSPMFLESTRPMATSKGIRIEATGWPRIDLWSPAYRSLLSKESEEIRAKFGTFILFPTSFGRVTKKAFSSSIEGSTHSGLDENTLFRLEALNTYTELLRELSTRLENSLIVVRPHNSELVSDWKTRLKGLENIEVVKDGDISAWIEASSAIIHWGSTSALQSALWGKPGIQYQIKKRQGFTDSSPFDLYPNADSVEQAAAMLEKKLGQVDSNLQKRAKIIVQDELMVDKTKSIDKVAKILLEEKLNPAFSPRISRTSRLKMSYLYFGSHAKKISRIGTKGIQVVAEKIPKGITPGETRRELELLQTVHPEYEDLSVASCGMNLVVIEKREPSI